MLVEREHELAALRAAIAAGGTIVVAGSFGSGKSALLAAAALDAAEAGVVCLSARGAEPERDYPGGVVRQLVDGARPGADLPDPRAALRRAIDHAAGGTGRVCVLVDDLQWVDAESLSALRHAVDRRPEAALIAALDPALGEGEALPARVAGRGAAAVVRPAPLSGPGVGALLERAFGEPVPTAVAEAYRAASGGRPQLVSALVAHGRAIRLPPGAAALAEAVEQPPRTLQRAVARRLERLPAAWRSLAHAAAVLGDGTPAATAARLAGIEPDARAPGIGRLVELGVLDDGEPVRFAAPLIRAAVESGLAIAARSALHARAAVLLAEAGASPADVAPHLLRAPRHAVADAGAMLATAAADARARGDAAQAVRYLQRAADESGGADGRTVAALGSAQLRVGRPRDAAATLARATALLMEPGERFRAAAELATALVLDGRARDALSVLAGSAADAHALGGDAVAVLEATEALAAWSDPDAFRGLRRSVPLMRDEPAGTDGRARLGRLAAEHALHGSALVARQLASRNAAAPPDEERHLPALALRELALVLADHPDAISTLVELEHAAGRSGAAAAIARPLLVAARLRAGDLDEVVRLGGQDAGRLAAVHVAEARLEQGRLDEAEAALRHAGGADRGRLPDLLHALTLGRLRARQGRPADALRAFGRCAELEASWSLGEPAHASWRAESALVHHGLGNAGAAQTLAEQAADRARRHGSDRLLGMALTTCARIGAADPAEPVLREAVALLERAGARLEAARARAELGSALRRGGQARAARRPLHDAEAVALDVGAAPLLAFVEQELALCGATSGPRRDRDELTPAERRTAQRAADGLKNREIAAALQISQKTVEAQLSHVYRKLGIRTRRELGAALSPRAHDRGP